MLSIFRTNQFFASILLFIYAAVVRISIFFVPQDWEPINSGFLSNLVYQMVDYNSLSAQIAAIVLLGIQATFLNLIITRQDPNTAQRLAAESIDPIDEVRKQASRTGKEVGIATIGGDTNKVQATAITIATAGVCQAEYRGRDIRDASCKAVEALTVQYDIEDTTSAGFVQICSADQSIDVRFEAQDWGQVKALPREFIALKVSCSI